jgi:beta-glucosidase
MGVAFVKGIQGDDPRYLKLAATLKHFAVNNVEKNRQGLDAHVPERMLYEYWLPHWREAVVEGGAQSVMASYNGINGTPNNINHWLLTDLLKDDWKFQGFVVSDLGGVRTMVNGHFNKTISYVDAVAKSLMAGCDFSDKEFMTNIPEAVREGKLTEGRLDDAVTRVMRVRMRLGEFDPQDMVPYSRIPASVICSPEHRQLALKAAREAVVLLENRNALLPLDRNKIKNIAVIGPAADRFTAGGYSGKPHDPVKPLQGIEDRALPGTQVHYVMGGEIMPPKAGTGTSSTTDPDQTIADACTAAKQADVAILFLGTTIDVEGEGHDRTTLALPGNQEQLAEAVIAANPRTVVVLMSAGPLTVPWLAQHAPAMLQGWWLGEEGGDAIADVIFGNTDPAGRLPYTVYASEAQVPPQDEYDITKGFTYMYIKGAPLYPFGYGLSYTEFKYSNLRLSAGRIATDGSVTVSVDVENTGSRAGDEVVQLYTHAMKSRVIRPSKELRGFERISLQPGEKKEVSITVPASKLAYYDVSRHSFVVEPGTYEFMAGASSSDIRAQAGVQVDP